MKTDRTIWNNTEKEDYINVALSVAEFIQSRKVVTENGIYWSVKDASEGKEIYYDEICLYAGSAGIIHYFLQLWEVTKDSMYLEDAKEASRYIEFRWNNRRKLERNFSPWAFSTGYAGVAYSILEMYKVTGDDSYKKLVIDIVEQIISESKTSAEGNRIYWSDVRGITGDAGTILFLLYAAEKLDKSDWKDFAISAGRTYLSEAKEYADGGKYYIGIDPSYFGFPEDYIDPNLMGTAGIGIMLLKLYEVSNDPEFLNAVDGITEFFDAISVGDEDAALVPYSVPNVRDLYYLGYCHGPVGTSRFFYKLYKTTGTLKSQQWYIKLVRGIIKAKAPEKHSNGYWNTHNLCCGTAGMTNLFLGVWAETGETEYLDYAKRTGEQILGWANHNISNGKKITKWYQAIDRTFPERLTTAIGFYDGAAGIGWVLLQLYLAETDNFHTERVVDDPYPLQKK